jgi:hypothetical protein
MRKVREILRLRFERGPSQRQISASTGVSKGALSDYLRRAAKAGVTWEVARVETAASSSGRIKTPARGESAGPAWSQATLPATARCGQSRARLPMTVRSTCRSRLMAGRRLGHVRISSARTPASTIRRIDLGGSRPSERSRTSAARSVGGIL